MRLDDIPPWFLRTFAVLFGLVWGSFLNVVIYRVPRGMSVVRPPSHCPGCGKPIAPWDNVPVVSYLLLRGRARCCGAKMSPRYPVVELIGGALSLAIVQAILLPLDPPIGRAAAVYGADLALSLGLVAAAFIDAEHMYLPDPITLGGIVLGLATATLRGYAWLDSVIGAAVGYGFVWLVSVVYRLVRRRTGIGQGDLKLAALAGAWFGWMGVVFVLFAGAVQGVLATIVIVLAKGKLETPEAVRRDLEELRAAADAGDEEAKKALAEDPLAEPQGEGLGQTPLPFGPFLILACLEFLFLGDRILDWYYVVILRRG